MAVEYHHVSAPAPARIPAPVPAKIPARVPAHGYNTHNMNNPPTHSLCSATLPPSKVWETCCVDSELGIQIFVMQQCRFRISHPDLCFNKKRNSAFQKLIIWYLQTRDGQKFASKYTPMCSDISHNKRHATLCDYPPPYPRFQC